MATAARVRTAVAWRVEARTRGLRRATRTATASVRARPTFLLIGAQKAGTTSLHAALGRHPAILLADDKEVHYFSLRYPQGERWYRSRFPLARPGLHAVGEATPAYLFDPRSAARAHAFDPGLKLVAVLRDPVDRAYAHFQMERETRDEIRSFEDALAWEEEVLAPELERWFADESYAPTLPVYGRSYVARGRYAEQVERWLALYPRERLLVLEFDEVLADPAAGLAQITRFLGLPDAPAGAFPRENVRTYEPMAPETREHLARVFEPHNRRLEELLGRRFAWTRPAGGLRPAASLESETWQSRPR